VSPSACFILEKIEGIFMKIIAYVADNGRMSSELVRIWKERVAYFKALTKTFAWRNSEKPRAIPFKVLILEVEIRTGD
jgi:hypothetical protein